MLLSASSAAPSTCLQCQLRRIIAGLRAQRMRAPPRLRYLSTTASLQQDEQDENEAQLERKPRVRNAQRDYVYRHIHPEGRIIGKPGRRQRQSSGQLATNSLGKPSEVILMHDVVEEAKKPKKPKHVVIRQPKEEGDAETITSSTPLSAEDIEAAITGKRQTPEQEEVNASINDLRPESHVLEKNEFKSLSRTLLDSYNARQLARYLIQSLSVVPASAETSSRKKDKSAPVELHATQWRPGRTPLEERIGRLSFTKTDLGTTKARLIDQIMRLSWHVTIHSEEQQLGELELYLKSWQMKMMFDLKLDGRPAYESFVDSPLLRRNTDVRPYRPDNVLRITARRQDSEEVVRNLQEKFASVRQLDINLNVFRSLVNQPGRPDSLDDLFKPEDIKHVSDRTGSVVEAVSGGKLAIYSMHERERHAAHARRLLLTLLDLPSPKSTTTLVPNDSSQGAGRRRALKTYSSDGGSLAMAEYPALDVHRRYHGMELVRLTTPVAKHAETEPSSESRTTLRPEYAAMGGTDGRRRLQRLVGTLDEHAKLSAPLLSGGSASTQEHRASVWRLSRGGQSSPWAAKFCVLLRPGGSSSSPGEPISRGVSNSTELFVTSYQIPGLSRLLSSFEPAQPIEITQDAPSHDSSPREHKISERDRPYLVAHFMPSPFSKRGIGALKTLPRIAISYRIDPSTRSLRLFDVKAALRKQELQVPFPEQAADLSFTRSSTMYMKVISRHQRDIDKLEQFTERLQKSMNASSGGTLDAMPELEIKLPWWVVQKHTPQIAKEEAKEDVPVEYLLDRLEQVQGIDFVPIKESRALKNADFEVKKLLKDWPEGMMLRLREVEAGVSGGRRTELRLISRQSSAPQPPSAQASTPEKSEENGGDGGDGKKDKALDKTKATVTDRVSTSATQSLTVTALRLLRLLTRVNDGTLAELNVT